MKTDMVKADAGIFIPVFLHLICLGDLGHLALRLTKKFVDPAHTGHGGLNVLNLHVAARIVGEAAH